MQYVSLVKLFISLIRLVEQNMPDSSGKEKFDAVLDIVETIVGAVDIPAFQLLATNVVSVFRATGVFKAKV